MCLNGSRQNRPFCPNVTDWLMSGCMINAGALENAALKVYRERCLNCRQYFLI